MRAATPDAQLADSVPAAFAGGGLDALPPADVAHKAETVGVAKARMAALDVFALSVLAGSFIALGAIFATTVASGGAGLPYGVVRLLAGLTFSLGLILVVVAGAELFTGNNLIVMAWASRPRLLGPARRQLDDRLDRELRGGGGDRAPPLRLRAVHLRRRCGR